MTGFGIRAVAAAVLGSAMLAGAAQATVVTYDFSVPLTDYASTDGTSVPPGARLSGSVSVDTAKLAQLPTRFERTPGRESVFALSVDPAFVPVTVNWTLTGTASDAFANSPLSGTPTFAVSEYFYGTGTDLLADLGETSWIAFVFDQTINSVSVAANGDRTQFDEERYLSLNFFSTAISMVDGYALPVAGTGKVSADMQRSRSRTYSTANFDPLPGSTFEGVFVSGKGPANGEGPVDAPEPGALGLLGLGLLGLTVRRRRAA